MKHPLTIEIESPTMTVDTIQQLYYRVQENEKRIQLNRLLLLEQPESCMIFCNTRNTVDRVQCFLSRKGYVSQALHGDIPQTKRLKTLQQFKQGQFHLLVATDVAARGIDINDLSLVINYDVPIEKDSYVHRIGRTGRAGNGGRAITLVTGEDIMTLYEIEEHIGALITEAEWPSEADYNEQRASVEKWIQANSQQNHSLSTASGANLRETKNVGSHIKPHQQYRKHECRSIDIKSDIKAVKRNNIVHPAERAKPVHVITKPVPSPTTEADFIHAQRSTEIEQSQASGAKNSLLQRVLQRIWSKIVRSDNKQ
jgi:superfamily II DNA/RNA helicase